jgi:tetratricopeptide (TPR) repeat protein
MDERAAPDERDCALRRRAAWCAQLVERAAKSADGPEQHAWRSWLDREHDGLSSTLEWALENGEVDLAGRMSAGLWKYWIVRGRLSEGRAWLDGVLDAGDDLPAETLAAVCNGSGALATLQGDVSHARGVIAEGLGIGASTATTAALLSSLAYLEDLQGEYVRAQQLYDRSLALHRGLGDPARIAAGLGNLGELAMRRGDLDTAALLLSDSVGRNRALGNTVNLALGINGLGETVLLCGDTISARALFEKGRALALTLDDHDILAGSLHGLGMVALERGEPRTAETLLREALGLRWQLGERDAVAATLEELSAAVAAGGGCDMAMRMLAAANALRQRTGMPIPAVHAIRRDTTRQALMPPGHDPATTWPFDPSADPARVITEALAS